jgi:cytochrome b561
METYQRAQRVLGWFVLLGATVQFFLAGLAVFRAKPHDSDKLFESSAFNAHQVVGEALIVVSFALLVLALLNRDQVRLALLLFVLMLVQYGLAKGGHKIAALGGLHPVNGVLILVIAHFLARGPKEARVRRRRPGREEPDEPATTAANPLQS